MSKQRKRVAGIRIPDAADSALHKMKVMEDPGNEAEWVDLLKVAEALVDVAGDAFVGSTWWDLELVGAGVGGVVFGLECGDGAGDGFDEGWVGTAGGVGGRGAIRGGVGGLCSWEYHCLESRGDGCGGGSTAGGIKCEVLVSRARGQRG